MFTQIDHVGIAVHSIDASRPIYEEQLGLEFESEELVETQGVRVAFFKAGPTKVELLEPLHDESPIARFLASRGEGVHHIAFATPDILEERSRIATSGIRLLSDEPKDGAHNKWVTFLHPKDTSGVLFEMCQPKTNKI